jgi:hypothetical protein
MNSLAITLQDGIPWIGIRFLDKTGRVFERDGSYYRAVYPHAEAHVYRVLDSPAFQQAVRAGFHVPVEKSSDRLRNYNLVLKSPACPWSFPADVWVTVSLKAAALVWIDFNLLLLDDDLQLADAHYNNYAFDGRCRPTWVDFGSIQPFDGSLAGFDEFVRLQCFPLVTLLSNPVASSVVRPSFVKGGISSKQAKALQIANWRVHVLRWLLKRKCRGNLRKKEARFMLELTRRIVNGLPVQVDTGFWSSYHSERPLEHASSLAASDVRAQKIREVVGKLKPHCIVDIGANNGYHLATLSSLCGKLLAVERDEVAVSQFVEWANRFSAGGDSKCAAAGIIGDLQTTCARGDLVLALALTHHVSLTEKYNFRYIAKRLAELSTNSVIVEFMPNGLGVLEKQTNLPEWYTLEEFLAAFQTHWSEVWVENYDLPADKSPRTLVVATRKIS